MKKTELALLYMPYASADVARRHLNKCIRRNRELLEALEATGWAFWIHWLTPLQVELIEKYLGEPVSPLNVLDRNGQQTDKKLQINDLWLFLLPESPASKTSKVR